MTSFDDTRTRTWAGHKVDRDFGMISRTSEVCFIHACAQWIQIHIVYEESIRSTTKKDYAYGCAHPFLITPIPRINCYNHFAYLCMRACLCVCVFERACVYKCVACPFKVLKAGLLPGT